MEELFCEKAAARVLGVTTRQMRRYRAEGLISYFKTPGGRPRYSLAQLLAAVEALRVRRAKVRDKVA